MIGVIINLFVKNLSHFFETDCKGKGSSITDKFLVPVLFTFASQRIHKIQRTIPALKAGCKSKGLKFTDKL